MEDGKIAFKRLFQKLIEEQQLEPEVAEKLLQRILEILFDNKEMDSGDG